MRFDVSAVFKEMIDSKRNLYLFWNNRQSLSYV